MKKNIIFLVGFMGSGKTTLGKALAKKINFDFLDTDERIAYRENRIIEEIFEIQGEDYFRSLELKVIKEICKSENNLVVSTGGGLPCFNENMETLLKSGFVVFLSTDVNLLYKRLENDNKRPLLKLKSNLMQYIEITLEARKPVYNKAHLIIDSSNLPHSIIHKIIEEWKKF